MSRGVGDPARYVQMFSVYERFGRKLANGFPEKRARIWGTFREGYPKNLSGRENGQSPQVAVLAGVLGAAACAFSWARFSSHSAFFLARRSRLRRAVRGSCGLPIVRGCLAEVFGRVALKSYSCPIDLNVNVNSRENLQEMTQSRPALAHAGCSEATTPKYWDFREKERGRSFTFTFTFCDPRSASIGRCGVFFQQSC